MNYSDCTKCDLHNGCKTVGIGGRGQRHPDLLIVGQNPGALEDARGSVFVGPSRLKLSEYLEAAGLKSVSYFVTNAVKCHTEKNAPPTPVHQKACRPYLIDEVQKLQPKLILALGNVALRVLTGQSGINKYAGKLLELHKDYGDQIPVLATFHPAAAMREARYDERITIDFRKAAAFLSPTERPAIAWHWCDDHAHLDDRGLYAFDYETTGLNTRTCKTITCAIDDGSASVHVFRVPQHAEFYMSLLLKNAKDCVGHNSTRFDDRIAQRANDTPFHSQDTMLAAALLDEEGVYSLEACAMRYLNVPPWKDTVTWKFEDLDLATTPQVVLDELATYNARDTRYTRELWLILKDHLIYHGLWKVYEHVLKPATVVLEEISKIGVYVSIDNIKEETRNLNAQGDVLREQLAVHVGDYTHNGKPFNYRSNAQIAELLYPPGVYPAEFTATGAASVGKTALLKLQAKFNALTPSYRFISNLLALRKIEKQISTYLKPWEKLALEDPEQRVRADYSSTTAVTGRTSSFNPNMQNIPRAKPIRRMVAARPGWVRMEVDESQLEMRLAAELSGCPALTEAFLKGHDSHALMGIRLVKALRGVDVTLETLTPEDRSFAKPPNFLLLYGAETYTLQQTLLKDYGLVLDFGTCDLIRETFFQQWPGLFPWYERVANDLKKNKLVRTKTGRIRHLPNIDSDDQNVRTEALRMAVNFEDQSFGSDIVMIGLMLLRDAIRANHLQEVILLTDTIHDSIGAEVKEGFEPIFADLAVRALTSGAKDYLVKHFGYELRIPLLAEVKCGPNWGEMRNYEH